MHRRIVEAILKVIEEHPRKDELDSFVKSNTTEGFWELVVIPKGDFTSALSHLSSIGQHIGFFYGESLHIQQTKHYVRFT